MIRPKDIARRIARTLRKTFAAERPIVLMYHRIETLPVDPWQLSVTPENFARQVELLGKHREIVPMSWLGAEIGAGRLPRHVAAITFDDGYADVYRNALPILEAADCPATVYVTTSAIDRTDAVYWWDFLTRVFLEAPALPRGLSVAIGGRSHNFDLGDAPPSTRATVHGRLHGLLKPLPRADRDAALKAISEATGIDPAPPLRDLPMTRDELARLGRSKVIEIGGHTEWHPSLTSLPPEAVAREVSESRRLAQEWTGQAVTGFAYPYGDFDERAVEAVEKSGYDYAVTTQMRWVGPGCDPLRIPRLLVADWDEVAFRREILING